MKKILFCLVICYVPVSWGQDDGMLDNWGGWNGVIGEPALNELALDKQPQLEIPLGKVEPLVNAGFQEDSTEKHPAIFGVGLDGSDEQQLNFLDGSSLMDYPEEQYENIDKQDDAEDDWFYYLDGTDAVESVEGVDFDEGELNGIDEID